MAELPPVTDPMPPADVLPAEQPCPYCGGVLAAYPWLSEVLAGFQPAGPPSCPRCDSRVTADGRPVRAGARLVAPRLSRYLVVPPALWLLYLALFAPDLPRQIALAALLVLLPLCEWVCRGEWVRRRAAAAAVRVRRDLALRLGEGDAGVGERLLDCDRRARPIRAQLHDLWRQLAVVDEAGARVAASRFQDHAAAYQQAAALLRAQVDERVSLLHEFAAYRRDLEAILAARRAERVFQPLDSLTSADALDAERVRLTERTEELLAAAEIEAELAALGVGSRGG